MCERGAIVIDNGSAVCKAGFAGCNAPAKTFPSTVGRHKVSGATRYGCNEEFVGADAQSKRDVLDLSHPIDRGVVTRWDDLEKLWGYVLRRVLQMRPEKHSLLFTDPKCNRMQRETAVELLFEKFRCPAVYVASPAALSLIALHSDTGIVLESGDGLTRTVPVYKGCTIAHAVCSVNLAGRDLTAKLTALLRESGLSFGDAHGDNLVRDIKERVCSVALDCHPRAPTPQPSSKKCAQVDYTLPDGRVIKIGRERFECPEALFKPSTAGVSSLGIHHMLLETLSKCDEDIRAPMSQCTVLSGGTCALPGLPERLQKEVNGFDPPAQLKIVPTKNSEFLPWLGGSNLALLLDEREEWFTMQDYNEYGPSAVHWKCFMY